MAYGKDPQGLGQVTGFGGTASQKAANATRKRAGGGGGFYWMDTFKPNQVEALWIRPISGQYITDRVDDSGQNPYQEDTPWIERYEHFYKRTNSGGLCSAGAARYFKDYRAACLGCDEHWAYDRDNKTISLAHKFIIGAVDYRNFHKMPSLDKRGQIRVDKNQQPYMDWNPCTQQGCIGCQTAQEHKQGHGQAYLMSKTHFAQLLEYNESDSIGAHCGNCFAQNSMKTSMWICGNSQCQDVIFDMSNTTVSKQQLAAVTKVTFGCTRCQVSSFLVEIVECSHCTPQGGQARRATIFDCDLHIKTVAGNEANQTTLTVKSYNGPGLIQPPYDAQIAVIPDLDKKFVIPSLERQSKIWGFQQTQIPGTQGMGVQQPGQPQGQQMGQPPQQQQQMVQQQQQPNAGQGQQFMPQQQGQPQQQFSPGAGPGMAPQQQMGQQPQQQPPGGMPPGGAPQRQPVQHPPQQQQQEAPEQQQEAPQQFASPYGQGQPQQQAAPQQQQQAPAPGFVPAQNMAQMPPQQQGQGFFGAQPPQPTNQPPLQHGLPSTGSEEEEEYNEE